MYASEALKMARRNSGGTFMVDSEGKYLADMDFNVGFMVSEPRGVENLPDECLSTEVLRGFIDAKEIKDATNQRYVGMWRDADGNWSIDISRRIIDRVEAEEVGRLYNQRAIWDNANNVSIDL